MHVLHKVKIVTLTILFTILSLNIVFANALDEFNEKKYNSAFRTAFTETMDGKPEAFYVLGKLYLFGLGDVKKNQNKALKNLNKAIKKKYAPAASFLAKEFKRGKFLKKNYSEARRLFILAQNLGGKDFSKMIASISQEMSDDDLTTTSCLDSKAAAEKNARNFYLYYIRCMINEEGVKRDIKLIKKYLKKLKIKPQQEEIVSLVKILFNGPNEIKNSGEAYNLIVNYINENKPNEKFLEKLTEIQNQILSSVYKEKNETVAFLKYLNSSINNKSISSDAKKALKSTINNINDNLINTYKQDDQIKSIIFKSISENNCDLLDKFIKSSDLNVIKEASYKVNISQIKCNDSLSVNLLTAIENLKKSNVEDAFNSYKKLCSLGVKHSCIFLGNMYINDNLPSSMNSFNISDRSSFALQSYSKSVDKGNPEAIILYADLSLTNNINQERANTLLDKAIMKGQIDGLYIKSKHLFKKFFSNKEACKNLKLFLNNNPTTSQYFEEAIQLNQKKCS
jgi:TPR repeat protein